MRKDSPIRTIEDLKGKARATNGGGSVVDIAMQYVLKKHRVDDKKDVTIVEVSLSNMFPMLSSGKVDLASLNTNSMHDPKIADAVRTLFEEKDALGVTDRVLVRTRNSSTRTAPPSRISSTTSCARDIGCRARRTLELLAMGSKLTKQPEAILASYYLLPGQDDYRDLDSRPDIAALQRNLYAMLELGFLKGRVDTASHADLILIVAAVARVRAARK